MELERFVTETGRPLPIFLLLDCSGSMSGEKINTLNQAVKDMIEDFKGERLSDVNLKICVITFGNTAKVHTELSSLKDLNYVDLVATGMIPLGGALNLASSIINDKEKVPSKGYRPVVVLVSDGHPNDSWEAPLNEFITGKRTSKCEKWALGIGQDVDKDMLEKFLNNPEKKVYDASVAKEITKFFKLVTLSTVARSKSVDPNQMVNLEELEEIFNKENPDFNFSL
jgi:uncharacterized protein YegL